MKGSGKQRGAVNFVDILILLLFILAVVAAVLFFTSRQSGGAASSDITISYKLECSYILPEAKDAAEVGDAVYESVNNTYIGTITDVVSSVYVENVYNSVDGVYVPTEIPGRYRVVITVESPASLQSGKITVNSYSIGVGKSVPFYSKHFSGDSYCIALNIKEGGAQ